MKKLLSLIVLFTLIFGKANAQSLDMISVDNAYEHFKSIDSINKYELLGVQAIGMPASGLLTNFDEGLANNWIFLTRLKDVTDNQMHMFIVLSMFGVYVIQTQSDTVDNIQEMSPLLNTPWFGSKQLAEKFKNSEELNLYKQVKGNDISSTFYMLIYVQDNFPSGKTEGNVWSITEAVSENDMAVCAFDAETGDNLSCIIEPPLRVNELSQKMLEFFPNPTTNKLKIKEIPEGVTNYEIFDQKGIKVSEGIISNEIDVSMLAAGSYFLSFKNGQKPIKFVKI